MKIGIFVDAFFPMIDGVINVVDNYAKRLNCVAEVTVFCPLVDNKKITDKPYKVVQCSSFSIKGFDYAVPTPKLDRAFLNEVKKSRLDVVHVHSPFSVGRIGMRYAKKHKIPLIATLHSQYKKDFERFLKIKLLSRLAVLYVVNFFNRCDECWTVNEDMKKLFVENYGLTSPCKVMPNATDHTPLKGGDIAPEKLSELFNFDKSLPIFLFVGRITYQKNLELIVNSLKILKEEGISFKMLFVGCGQDEKRLKADIEKANLQGNALLLGKITDKSLLSQLYKVATLFLFPSLYDANSLVQIESACQGTPTLFVKGAKTACQVEDGKNGFIAENDAKSYALAIKTALENKELYNTACIGCRELYFSWEEIVNKVYSEYGQKINELNACNLKKVKSKAFKLGFRR